MCPHGDLGTAGDVITDTPPSWLAGRLAERRPLVMGILNVTPDFFRMAGALPTPNEQSRKPSA